MQDTQLSQISNFIWGVADDYLRDLYVRGKYRDVILPMIVLRRLDAVLEPTKEKVLDEKKWLDDEGISEQAGVLEQAAGQAFYNTSPFQLRDLTCPIEGRYHHCSEHTKEKQVRGDLEIPATLYKYIPKELIVKGVSDSLRATQILALNDDMECNVTTMNDSEQVDALAFLALVQSKLEGHLGITIPWEELLERSISYGDLRLSTFIQEYLNPRVGVIAFTTDILVPTMWAHYAQNTGIVVG